jgi:outer membrane lipoprotein-sorting protein
MRPPPLAIRFVSLAGLGLLGLTVLAPAGAQEGLTPDHLLARVEARIRSLQDYECVADCETRIGEKTDPGSCHIWYMSPGLLRVKGMKGRNRGAEVVMDNKGTIRGRKGGLLKPFVVKLKADDARVCNVRGTPVTALCWTSICRRLRERLGAPGARASLAPHSQPDAPYELSLVYTEGGRSMQERCRIDPSQWLPLEARLLEDGREVERVEYREIKLNTGLDADWFHL